MLRRMEEKLRAHNHTAVNIGRMLPTKSIKPILWMLFNRSCITLYFTALMRGLTLRFVFTGLMTALKFLVQVVLMETLPARILGNLV